MVCYTNCGSLCNGRNSTGESIQLGVSKINIYSDMKYAYFTKAREILSTTEYWDPLYFPKSQTKSVCQVEGCNGKHKSLGYCSKHYKRFRSHGDPFLVATTHGEIKTEFCWSTTCRRAYSF